jgi:GT2 family glycosyltransferase
MNASSAPSTEANAISISVVVYRPDPTQLQHTLDSSRAAVEALRRVRPGFGAELFIVDNGGLSDAAINLEHLRRSGFRLSVISGHGNVGYGRGHNLAIGRATSKFHLILNPDIDLDREALINALDFLDRHQEAGLLTPRIGNEKGHLQYLCRRYPTPA